jgi:hypothetical protein
MESLINGRRVAGIGRPVFLTKVQQILLNGGFVPHVKDTDERWSWQ